MPKRRTKKQKISARHQFRQSWAPAKAHVKRQNNIGYEAKIKLPQKAKKADILAQPSSVKAIRLDIIKSLILASLILSLEVVIYLAKLLS